MQRCSDSPNDPLRHSEFKSISKLKNENKLGNLQPLPYKKERHKLQFRSYELQMTTACVPLQKYVRNVGMMYRFLRLMIRHLRGTLARKLQLTMIISWVPVKASVDNDELHSLLWTTKEITCQKKKKRCLRTNIKTSFGKHETQSCGKQWEFGFNEATY